jgi:hypothetical protein
MKLCTLLNQSEKSVPDSRLFLIKLELEKGFTREFVDWFAGVHAPSLLRAGFRTVNSFLSHGSDDSVFNIHEILGAEIFDTEDYKREIASDEVFVNHIKKNIISRSNSIYRQIEVFRDGLAQGSFSSIESTLVSPVVSVSATNLDDFKYFKEYLRSAGFSIPGMYRLRFCQLEGQHPSGKSIEPEYAVIIEWSNQHSALQFFANFESRVDSIIGRILVRSMSNNFFTS